MEEAEITIDEKRSLILMPSCGGNTLIRNFRYLEVSKNFGAIILDTIHVLVLRMWSICIEGNLVKAGDNEIELIYSDKSIIINYENIIDAKVIVSFK